MRVRSGDDILNKLGVTDSAGAFSNVLQVAQSALFTLDGISMTRNTNDISDVLGGITFDLLQATPSGTTINISIGPDTTPDIVRAADLRHQLQRLSRRGNRPAGHELRRHGVVERRAVR